MKGKTLLIKQNVGWFDCDIRVRTSKGKKTKWTKAWAKKAQRKLRKNLNTINLYEEE